MIEVVEALKPFDDFIQLPLELFSKEPYFVPQLSSEMRVHFSEKNPFFRHADVKYFIALKNGKTKGRIAVFVNRMHNEYHHEKMGFFGFFDCTRDFQVATALFERAARFLKERGMKFMRGPMNFSTNEECGFLLEGFEECPLIMMPYNPPYYNEFSERFGMQKCKDLFAYIYHVQEKMPEKVYRVAAIAAKRGVTVRPIRMKNFREDMMIFREVYHSAWMDNWGFIPMTEEELDYAAKRLKQIIIPEMALIAEDNGNPVGFMGLIPDFNFVLKKMNGKLNPLSILKAFYYSKKIRDLRIMLLGIKKEYRNKGVEAILYMHAWPQIKKRKYKKVEFSWILEDNIAVQRTIEVFGGRLYKKYRIYEKAL